MRDYVVLALIFASVPVALFDPYLGVLVWNWIAFFNPHRYTWSFAYNFPVAQVVGAPTLLGIFLSRSKTNRPFFVRETVLLFLFWIWCGAIVIYCNQTPELSGHSQEAVSHFVEVSKILLMTFVAVLLVTSRDKLRWLVVVVSLSLGIRAIIALNFEFVTGGQSRVYGPPGTFISENNAFGLALNMVIPMLFFLRWDVSNRYILWLLRVAVPASILSVILTYSRGDLLGLCIVLLGLALRSRHKLASVSMLAVCVFLILTFAPARWMDRMGNFAHGNLDQSAEERLVTWQFALNFINAYPVTGGSFGVFEDVNVKRQYAPTYSTEEYLYTEAGPHSIYFQTLGEQGIGGLAIYVLMLASCILTVRRLRKRARKNPAFAWMIPYCNMLEIGVFAFAVSGATLGLAYFDLYFTFVACTAVLAIIYKREAVVAGRPQKLTPVGELEPILT